LATWKVSGGRFHSACSSTTMTHSATRAFFGHSIFGRVALSGDQS
jgi:hypothetical protein